jgi:type IV pilus assembly protein PilC
LTLKLPVFGKLIKDIQIADFTRTLELMLVSGVDISRSLEITAASLGNIIFRKTIEGTVKSIEKGVPLAVPISQDPNFPIIVSQMIAVGEETGKVDVILGKLNEYYTEEVNHTVNNLTSLLEPIILVVMGTVVGFIAISIYMPIFKVGESIGGI